MFQVDEKNSSASGTKSKSSDKPGSSSITGSSQDPKNMLSAGEDLNLGDLQLK